MKFGGFKQFALGICISYFSSSRCYNKTPKMQCKGGGVSFGSRFEGAIHSGHGREGTVMGVALVVAAGA